MCVYLSWLFILCEICDCRFLYCRYSFNIFATRCPGVPVPNCVQWMFSYVLKYRIIGLCAGLHVIRHRTLYVVYTDDGYNFFSIWLWFEGGEVSLTDFAKFTVSFQYERQRVSKLYEMIRLGWPATQARSRPCYLDIFHVDFLLKPNCCLLSSKHFPCIHLECRELFCCLSLVYAVLFPYPNNH